jgi:hypothetical protein
MLKNAKRIILSLIATLLLAAVATTTWAQSDEGQDRPAQAKLVGTWRVVVPTSAGGSPPFEALHTYHDDGTLTETSSLLGTLSEGPAQGVWKGHDDDFAGTFELFIFDQNGAPVGKVRVRTAIHLDSRDHLSGRYAVDLLDPNGTVTPDIDSGTFTGTRMRVEPLR